MLLNYDYRKLADYVDQMREVNQRVTMHIENLDNETKQALASWTGDSADSYNAESVGIQTDLTDLNSILDQLHNAVTRGADDMQAQDKRSSGGFGGR